MERDTTNRSGLPQIRIAAVVAVVAAVGIAVWVIYGGRSSKTSSSTGPTTSTPAVTTPSVPTIGPEALSAVALRKLSRTIGVPIYWAGPKKGQRYELTRTAVGRIFVRYLPRGVAAGAPGSSYLVVATYPYPNALNALKSTSKTGRIKLPGGGIAVVDAAYTKSVHLAYPGVAYEVEVYNPSPAVARRVAASGAVRPVS